MSLQNIFNLSSQVFDIKTVILQDQKHKPNNTDKNEFDKNAIQRMVILLQKPDSRFTGDYVK